MKDILLNTELDLDIADGDLVVGESTVQHQQLLLVTSKGDWKENPLIGVGAAAFLKDEDESGLLNMIRIEFQKDGMDVKAVNIQSGEINIDANY
jgi:protein involved in temperature-dependent protein secretion